MHDVRTLLAHIPALQRPCDLDLLVFFARHWRVLLSSEQLSRLLGYPLKEVARSRDVLVGAGLLRRLQDPTRAERMFVFDAEGMKGEALPAILTLASTPQGRLALRRALTSDAASDKNNLSEEAKNPATPRDAWTAPNSTSAKRTPPSERRAQEEPERTDGRS